LKITRIVHDDKLFGKWKNMKEIKITDINVDDTVLIDINKNYLMSNREDNQMYQLLHPGHIDGDYYKEIPEVNQVLVSVIKKTDVMMTFNILRSKGVVYLDHMITNSNEVEVPGWKKKKEGWLQIDKIYCLNENEIKEYIENN